MTSKLLSPDQIFAMSFNTMTPDFRALFIDCQIGTLNIFPKRNNHLPLPVLKHFFPSYIVCLHDQCNHPQNHPKLGFILISNIKSIFKCYGWNSLSSLKFFIPSIKFFIPSILNEVLINHSSNVYWTQMTFLLKKRKERSPPFRFPILNATTIICFVTQTSNLRVIFGLFLINQQVLTMLSPKF